LFGVTAIHPFELFEEMGNEENIEEGIITLLLLLLEED
jgi:hypothetical protein